MSEYFFKNGVTISDYTYIFLCGASFTYKTNDKREVLSTFLKKISNNNRPIILEKYFLDRYRKTTKKITYSDAGFSNLYQVEMMVNYLSDINIIILESISTGAEAGMFLGEPSAQAKTCLLLPDEMAVEEDKLGAFLRLSIKKTNVSILRFYPQMEKYKLSENVKGWHTFFNKNDIGHYLGEEIKGVISNLSYEMELRFSSDMSELKIGKIYYKYNKDEDRLVIKICPRTLMVCVGALLNCEEYEKAFFLNEGYTILEAEEMIVSWLRSAFINSIAELKGIKASSCKIEINMNMEELSPNRTIGMILYLLYAAELITITKKDDYDNNKKVEFGKKMIVLDKGNNNTFYRKYENCVGKMIDKKIVL